MSLILPKRLLFDRNSASFLASNSDQLQPTDMTSNSQFVPILAIATVIVMYYMEYFLNAFK